MEFHFVHVVNSDRTTRHFLVFRNDVIAVRCYQALKDYYSRSVLRRPKVQLLGCKLEKRDGRALSVYSKKCEDALFVDAAFIPDLVGESRNLLRKLFTQSVKQSCWVCEHVPGLIEII